MAKRIETTEELTQALLMRCVTVHDSSYESETLVACEASDVRQINAEERQKLLTFTAWNQYSNRHVLVELLSKDNIEALVAKAEVQAEKDRIKAEQARIKEEARHREAEKRRKQRRLRKLEQMAARED